MSYDAKKAAYQEVTILGRPALFAECRIDNSTVPKGLYRYELRHGDENWGDPVSLSRNIIVNYYGAVLTREPFQLPIEGWIPLEDDSLSFQDGGCRTLAEFQRKYPVSKKDVIDFFVANDDSLHDFYFSHSEAQDKAISGFIAKESVVSTLQILLGGAALSTMFTGRSVISFLVFTLLYTPCIAAVTTIRREFDSALKTVGVVMMQCCVAWIVALAVYTLVGIL